jgi:hypothetical protein
MEHVYFKPWVGKNYFKGDIFPKRVLVLGESHYEWDPNIPLTEFPTFDCIQIQDQIDGKKKQFWTKIVIAFLNRYPLPEDRGRFWHSVAFYNYVQEPVGFGARTRPTKEMWINSQQSFFEILQEYNPHCIIVLGFELWKHLPSNFEKGPKIDNAKRPETRRYPTGNGTYSLAYAIIHPASWGFSGRDWYSFIMRAIELS